MLIMSNSPNDRFFSIVITLQSRNVTIRNPPYCYYKKSREVIREIFYNSMEASVLFVRLESRYGDSVIHR